MTKIAYQDSETLEGIIPYADIPKFADTAERGQRYVILLSRFQANLYRKKIQHDLTLSGKDRPVLDGFFYGLRLGLMLLCCRNLLLLSYFHDFDPLSLKAIEFRVYEEKVLVILNNSRNNRGQTTKTK